jgi:hypothetical protein
VFSVEDLPDRDFIQFDECQLQCMRLSYLQIGFLEKIPRSDIKETLAVIHPIVRVTTNHCVFSETTNALDLRKRLSGRIFVTSAAGILVLKKHSLHKILTIECLIPCHQLLIIDLDGSKVQLGANPLFP